MKVIVVHIFTEPLACLCIQLISMHDCGDYVVRSEFLLYEVICFLIELLRILIASMIFKVCRVDIDDDLIEQGSILTESSGGDHSLGLESPEDLGVGLITRILEVDVVPAHLSYNVLIAVALVPALIVPVDLVKPRGFILHNSRAGHVRLLYCHTHSSFLKLRGEAGYTTFLLNVCNPL